MVTILYAHPYEKSFNHAILETIVDKLAATGREYKVIDLYADGFNPAMEAESLRLFSCDESADPHVPAYLATLMASDEFIMIFPIWWSTMPAIVDGFFDKVMLGGGKAFQYAPDGRLVPAAIHMKRTLMISTSEAPTEVFKDFFADYFPRNVLATVGMENVEWYNCPQTSNGSDEHRKAFLSMIYDKI